MPAPIFQHAIVRDLAWAGFSEPLVLSTAIGGWQLQPSTFWREHLKALDRDPAPLSEFLADATDSRLGMYYERLWHYLLTHDPDSSLLAHNLPVRAGGRTIGEFDCLFWCRRRKAHVHLELAVKFYLGIPGAGYWLGPGGRDRLDAKLEHLVQRQGQLSAHPAARESLSALGIDDCQGAIDIKGYLFAPAAGMRPPDGHNPANPLRTWFTLDEFRRLDSLPAGWVGWQRIPRRRWLGLYRAEDGQVTEGTQLTRQLAQRFAASGRPVQLAACDALGIEQRRCFVTPNQWPDDASHKTPSG